MSEGKKTTVLKALDKYAEMGSKKTIHIALSRKIHADFRKKLFDFDLSMQETIEYFAFLITINNSTAIKIVNDLKNEKQTNLLEELKNNLDEIEMENLYDAISTIGHYE
jgi:hypothetical protein